MQKEECKNVIPSAPAGVACSLNKLHPGQRCEPTDPKTGTKHVGNLSLPTPSK
jgi:hypothetical protein